MSIDRKSDPVFKEFHNEMKKRIELLLNDDCIKAIPKQDLFDIVMDFFDDTIDNFLSMPRVREVKDNPNYDILQADLDKFEKRIQNNCGLEKPY